MSSLLGPVTDADLRRWQQRRLDLLVELVKFGHERCLPPLTWTLGPHALVGRALGADAGWQRAAFETWTAALELNRVEDHVEATGAVRLYADTEDLWGRGVGVTVMAYLLADEDADGGS